MKALLKKEVSEIVQSEKEQPAFSQEFLSMMEEYGFTVLEEHLQKLGVEQDMIDLIENLRVLSSIQRIFEKEEKVLYIWNQEAADIVGRISKMVPRYGNHFITPSGLLLAA